MTLSNGRVTSRILLRRAEALRKHLPAAVAGEDAGVHQARVATRRLREAVPVLAARLHGSKAGKARKKIRKLTRALGSVRELDVTLHVVEELIQIEHLPRPALEAVRRHVIEERDRRREVMLDRLEAVNTQKLVRRLESLAGALDESRTEGWREALSARVTKRAARLDGAVLKAGQLYDPERLHRVRIAAKTLRYGLELAADSGVKPASPAVRRIKRVQDLLGRLHDLQVVKEHIAAVQASPSASEPGMHARLDAVAQYVEAECRHLHARYLMMAASIQAIIDQVRTRVIPEIERAPRLRPLKMQLARRASARASGEGC